MRFDAVVGKSGQNYPHSILYTFNSIYTSKGILYEINWARKQRKYEKITIAIFDRLPVGKRD